MKISHLFTATILSIICLSCTKPFIEERSLTLYSGEKHQLKVTSQFSVIYKVENEYHASAISSTNTIIAKYVGHTVVHADNTMNTIDIPVTVIPRYRLYSEPESWDFTLSRYDVIDKFGTPDNTSDRYMAYDGYYKAQRLVIQFDTEYNRVASYNIYLKASIADVSKFLNERYPTVTTEKGDQIWANGLEKHLATLGIMLQKEEINGQEFAVVTYFPFEKNTDFGYDISDWH